jgi:hypothetical protein
MAIQTATLGDLEKLSQVLIGEAMFTAEFNAPCVQLIERYTLGKGEYTYRFPKFSQASFSALTDGIDITDSQDFNMTYVDASPSEVGAKFIVTDKCARELKPEMMRVAGRMLGDGMGRKRDEDVIVLFASLDSAFGADNKYLSSINSSYCVSNMRALKAPNPISVVHHPNAIGYLAIAQMAVGATYWAGFLDETTRKILSNFWRGVVINQVPFFDDGNIAKIAGTDSAYGAIFSKSAMGLVESLAPYTATERDESMRATEINMIADYICKEVDGAYGASMRYEIGTNSTSA